MKRTSIPLILGILFTSVFALGIWPAQTVADEHRGCAEASLQGSFGFTSIGALLTLPAPFAGPFGEIGRQTFDGRGNTEGTATLSANGNIMKGVTFQGTYSVNPDCTGDMTLLIQPFNATATLDLVIDDNGAELRVISTGQGNVETREYRKQFPRGRQQ